MEGEKNSVKSKMSYIILHFLNCNNALFLKPSSLKCDCNKYLHDKLFFKEVTYLHSKKNIMY